jgi:hypothetical protein
MSEAEYKAMLDTGRVQAPHNGAGATHVTVPSNPERFTPATSESTHFVEFDVPTSQLRIHDKTQGMGEGLRTRLLRGPLHAEAGTYATYRNAACSKPQAHCVRPPQVDTDMDFEEAKKALDTKTREIRTESIRVEQSSTERTARIRLERGDLLGEVTIWDSGWATFLLGDANGGSLIIDVSVRFDGDSSYQDTVEVFFKHWAL